MDGLPKMLTIEEVADYLSVPVSTLRYWRWQGHGPTACKIGRRVMYTQEALTEWINAQTLASYDGLKVASNTGGR